MAIDVTKSNFEQVVLNSDRPVLLDFWASWCGPCRAIAPVIEQLAEENQGKAVIGKVNVDEEPSLASQYGVMSIPTLMLFSGGRAVNKMVGVRSKEDIQKMIDSI